MPVRSRIPINIYKADQDEGGAYKETNIYINGCLLNSDKAGSLLVAKQKSQTISPFTDPCALQ